MPADLSLGSGQEQMAAYLATARQRQRRMQRELADRKACAWQVARRAATVLKEQFGAVQVAVFGSLVHGHWFCKRSDIDLAVWGLRAEDYFVAVARLQDLSPEFEIGLVAVETCRPDLRETIVREGREL